MLYEPPRLRPKEEEPEGRRAARGTPQELVRDSGGLLWVEPDYQLTGAPDPLRVVGRALREGLAAPWAAQPQPTSALTHLGMFEFLRVPREPFFFQRMVDPSVLLLFDSPQVRPTGWTVGCVGNCACLVTAKGGPKAPTSVTVHLCS